MTPPRYADSITLDHIIELRKRVNDLERFLANFEDHSIKVRRALMDVREIIRHSDEPRAQVLRLIDETLRNL